MSLFTEVMDYFTILGLRVTGKSFSHGQHTKRRVKQKYLVWIGKAEN